MNCKDIYEAMRLRQRFIVIIFILGLIFICQVLYFYSDPNPIRFELPNYDAEVVKTPLKTNKTLINTRNLFQGIKLHREIAKNKDALKGTTNIYFTHENTKTEDTSPALPTSKVNFDKKLNPGNTSSHKRQRRKSRNTLKEGRAYSVFNFSIKTSISSTTQKTVLEVIKFFTSEIPHINNNIRNKSIGKKSNARFEVDKNVFAAESNFNKISFNKLPVKEQLKKNKTENFENPDQSRRTASNIDFHNVKDHRITKVDRNELSRDEVLFGTLKPKNISQLKNEVRIVSMSLYGSEGRYMAGALENAKMVRSNFPGWSLRFYVESPLTKSSKYGQVPLKILEKLRNLGADIHYIVPEEDFLPPMMWRFLIADDPSVDRFIVRDVDSRLTKRDFAAVQAWMRSGQAFQCIRDHPSHAGQSVSGGLWGGESHKLRIILRSSWIDAMRGWSSNYFSDMDFLQRHIWPRVVSHAYCSDSTSCDRWPNSFPFPVQRYGFDHVGEVYDERNIGRKIDIRILQRQGENERCLAPHDY